MDQKQDARHTGYSDQAKFGEFRVARFAANSNTPMKQAADLSHFRAVDVCHNDGLKLASILLVDNISQSSEHLESSSVVLPNAGWGSSTSGQARIIKNTFPAFDTFYRCQDKIYLTGLEFTFKTAEEMKGLVKDLMAGVQIVKKEKGSINSDFEVGDIIIKINGERVQDKILSAEALYPNIAEPIEVAILRNGEPRSLKLRFSDVSDSMAKAQNNFIKQTCGHSEYFQWRYKLCKEFSG